MQDISYNNLPQAVSQLYNKLQNIEQLLQEGINKNNIGAEQWFDLTELCNYLPDKPVKATVYSWVQAGTLPYHKGAKKLRFSKSEIDQWLKGEAHTTNAGILSEVRSYMSKPKRRDKW